jgi:signal transduction histidine kinase/BarA-like signal transduction histidine kinase
VGLALSSYLILSTLLENQVQARKNYLERELSMASGRVQQQVEEFKNEIPYVSDADDFGAVFNEKSPEAARLRFRLKRIAARYRSFIDTLIVYNRTHMYFIHASREGVTEEGYKPLNQSALPLQFTPTTKFVHISGSKSLSIIPVTWDSSKVHVGVLLDLFQLIKKESDMQFIGDYGVKLIFSEYQGVALSDVGDKISQKVVLPSSERMRIVGDMLEHIPGSMRLKMPSGPTFLTVYTPMEMFNEKFGMVFMISEEDYINPIRMTIYGIVLLYLFIIGVIISVFFYNLVDINRKNRELEQNKLELSQLLAVLNAQLEASADAILMLDREEKVIMHNNNFLKLFSIANRAEPNTTFETFKSFLDRQFNTPDWYAEAIEKLKVIPDNILTTEMPSGDKHYEIYTAPIISKDGEIYGRLWAFSDITTRKKEFEELIAAKRLADLGAREKENFLSTMSHEIRTPLNAIVGFSELLLNETPREEQKEYLLPLKYSADSLLALINDILDLSKIESGSIVFNAEPCNIRERLERLTQIFKMKAQQSGVSLQISVDSSFPEKVNIDITRFDQIIINLLSNAVKFTHEGEITVEAKGGSVGSDNEMEMLVSVIDTGIGISEEKLSNIFKSFYQADSNTTRKYGGTGLGLAISRKLVELQGGYIRAQSELGKGSTFFFMLPVITDTRSSNIEGPAFKDDISLKGVKILLVEDNPFNQKVAERFLFITGAEVVTADNGRQALDSLAHNTFDIVLLDLQMPDMDGFEVAHHVRNDLALSKYLPIIALTADAQSETRQKAKDCGIDDLLLKPFDHKVLTERIYMLLKAE